MTEDITVDEAFRRDVDAMIERYRAQNMSRAEVVESLRILAEDYDIGGVQ